MRQHHHTIFRQMYIRLYGMRADLDGAPESGHGVLGEGRLVPAMRNRLG